MLTQTNFLINAFDINNLINFVILYFQSIALELPDNDKTGLQ